MTSGRDRLGISAIQVVAGAAAAATAAFASSVLGVAGTVLGAAIVSTLVTVGAAVYDHSLRRARVRIRLAREAKIALSAAAAAGGAAPRPVPVEGIGEESVGVLGEGPSNELGDEPEDDPVPALEGLDLSDERGYHWGHIALVALTVFAVAMATITAFELVSGRPLSSLFTGDGQGTSIQHVFRPGRAPKPTPTPTPTLTPSPAQTPTVSPTVTVTTTSSAVPTPTPTVTATITATVTPTPTPSTSASPTSAPLPTRR